MTCLILIAPFISLATAGNPEIRDYPIGFVSHYPLITHNDDEITKTGANVCIVRAPWALIEPEEDKWDFSILDKQLEWAHRTGMKLIFLIEAGPAHAGGVKWLVEKLKAMGETMSSAKGDLIDDPCYQSQTYRVYLSRFIRKTIAYLMEHKYADCIYGYNNGCEWWHQLIYSYSKPDKEGFREWLKERYQSIQSLNEEWGTRFESWEEIEPPVLSPVGLGEWEQGIFLPQCAICDLCFCTTEESHIKVTPGEKLAFEVQLETENLSAGSALLEIAWLKEGDPRPFKIEWSPPFREPKGKGVIRFHSTVPSDASRAWLLLKLRGVGKVTFHQVEVLNDAGENLVSNPELEPAKGGWQFVAWFAGQQGRASHTWMKKGEASIVYEPEIKLEGNPDHPLAVINDWFSYRFESFARFIDWMAKEILSQDSSHPIISYLTFSFANPFEWDYVQDVAMALDFIGKHSAHQQVIGMQINSAEGDFDSLTCAMDLVRRLGKPLWAIDLLDFTKGIYLGERGLTRTALSVLQHKGAESGIQFYCWYGTPDYNYAELGMEVLQRIINRVKDVAQKLEGYEPICEVALIQPRMPLYPFLPEPPNDWADFMGWYKLLVRTGLCPDIYTLESLGSAELGRYKAIIVPDCAYLTREALRTLNDAVANGVKLISSGRFGLRDMSGREIKSDAFPPFFHRFSEPIGKRILGETYRLKDKGNTPPRLICRGLFPNLDLPEVNEVIEVLERAGVKVLLRPSNLTASLTLVPFQKGGKRLVFLLPQSEWEGEIFLEGKSYRVEPLGSLINLAAKED